MLISSYYAGTADYLPYTEIIPFHATRPVATFLMYPTWKPVLYVSPRRLSWSVLELTSTSSSIGTTSRLFRRPAWMDHPGKPLPGSGACRSHSADEVRGGMDR